MKSLTLPWNVYDRDTLDTAGPEKSPTVLFPQTELRKNIQQLETLEKGSIST